LLNLLMKDLSFMKANILAVFVVVLLAFACMVPLLAAAKNDDVQLTVLELRADGKPGGTHGGGGGNIIPLTDNAGSNPDYALLRFHWFSTADYWVNPAGATGLNSADVVNVVQAATSTWDDNTNADVFAYKGETSLAAGTMDGKNVVDWGPYNNNGVIAVTMIWSQGGRIVETDLRMNTYYTWTISANGVSGTMDMQSILTHEFGHWAGLDDLYKNRDYWLTMYGYADYGQAGKQTLGQGDINGLWAVYGQ
jgi:hypothetical protein